MSIRDIRLELDRLGVAEVEAMRKFQRDNSDDNLDAWIKAAGRFNKYVGMHWDSISSKLCDLGY